MNEENEELNRPETSAEIPAEETVVPVPETAEEPISPAESVAETEPENFAPEAEEPSVEAPAEAPEISPAEPVKKKKKSKAGLWIALGITVACLLIGGLIAGLMLWDRQSGGAHELPEPPEKLTDTQQTDVSTDITNTDEFTTSSATDVIIDQEDSADLTALSDRDLIRKVSPSVVTVVVSSSVRGYRETESGFGTGMIFSKDGYVLTCAHVVESSSSVYCINSEGKQIKATVVGFVSAADVAVLKLENGTYPCVEFAKSSQVVSGDHVIAIGTPFDQSLALTATDGMVSGIRNNLELSSIGTFNVIQHSAAINPGNSGGPLFDCYGRVIGMNSMKISGSYDNLGFALAIDDVLQTAQTILNNAANGKPTKGQPAIGISGYTYTSGDTDYGVYVYLVAEGGAADKAGLRAGDLIVSAGDKTVTNMDELKEIIAEHEVGDKLELGVVRNGRMYRVNLTLTAAS